MTKFYQIGANSRLIIDCKTKKEIVCQSCNKPIKKGTILELIEDEDETYFICNYCLHAITQVLIAETRNFIS